MTKRIFNLRNVAAITLCLAVMTMFSGCDKDPDSTDPGEEQEADIVAFTFEGIEETAAIDPTEHTVTAKAEETTDLTAMKAEFTLSLNATATVNGAAQVSKQTANNFTNPVTYIVTSADGKTTNEWTVTITKTGGDGSDITKNRPAVYSITLSGNQNSDNGYHMTYTKLSIMTADGYYEKTDYSDTETSGVGEDWFVLATKTSYWQGNIVNLITGQSGSGSTSETYSSEEQTLYYANQKAVELNASMVWWSEYTIASVRIGSEIFLGRDCAKFVYESNSSETNRKTEYWIDKATGACLKYIDDLQTTEGYVKTSWACTEFKIGGVTLPPHPEE